MKSNTAVKDAEEIKRKKMSVVNLIFPHQLFEDNPLFKNQEKIYLIEELLFFKYFAFHKQKLTFHRASMKAYEQYLLKSKHDVNYINTNNPLSDLRLLIKHLAENGVNEINAIDPVDDWLKKRLSRVAQESKINLVLLESPNFINEKAALEDFFSKEKKKYFQTKFYIAQRKKLSILIDDKEKPIGAQWSFDAENRKKYPKKKLAPAVVYKEKNPHQIEAIEYVKKHFKNNPGLIEGKIIYPIDFESSKDWLQQFLDKRFNEFGTYEDAIVANEHILNHSMLTPMMNVGLLTPKYVIDIVLRYSEKNDIPINSVEGFVRQVIGWREFIRGVYESQGVKQRTNNFWKFTRKIPESFYDGTTGIMPLDLTIKKVLATGYCHHIERLMILGNFMVLCEFDPDEVYRWFMELFVDAYDWVMVPNVYGMSQFADGGLMSTKPYISGSNYIKKMSNYPKGDWEAIWDGLFWHFMWKQRWFFEKNPRLSMLVRNLDKMDAEKKNQHIENANNFLNKL